MPLESNQELQPLFDSPDMFIRLGLYEFIRSRTLDLVFDNWSDLSEGNEWLAPTRQHHLLYTYFLDYIYVYYMTTCLIGGGKFA